MGRIDYVQHPNYVELIINNPRYDNCIGDAMWSQLYTYARGLSEPDDSIRAVVIRGTGSHFTSGYDLSELAGCTFENVNRAFENMENAMQAIEEIPVPVIAVLSGYCLGGGMELALSADLRIADDSVKLGMPVAKIGIMLSPTFALRLVKAIGISKTKELLFTGRFLSADEAERLSLVNKVVDTGHASGEATRWIEQIEQLYPRAIRQAKRSVASIGPHSPHVAPYFVDQDDFFEAISRFKRKVTEK